MDEVSEFSNPDLLWVFYLRLKPAYYFLVQVLAESQISSEWDHMDYPPGMKILPLNSVLEIKENGPKFQLGCRQTYCFEKIRALLPNSYEK